MTATALLIADLCNTVSWFDSPAGEASADVIAGCQAIIRDEIAAAGGIVLETAGDEWLARFDSAPAAADAALAMHARSEGQTLKLRIGLHFSPDDEATALDEAIEVAARITGLARGKEIFCSLPFNQQLSPALGFEIKPRPQLGSIKSGRSEFGIAQLTGKCHADSLELPLHGASTAESAPVPAACLSLHYKNQVYVVSEQHPVLTIGRDHGNQTVIDDRRVSRQHARIEQRGDAFYLLDTSTNGTFVGASGRQEELVRRDELRLESNSTVCFGSSANDPTAACARVEVN